MLTPVKEQLGEFLINRFGDRYLYEVNRSVFDQVGSEILYKKYFGEELFQPNRFSIMVGTDSGVMLRYLKKRTLPDGSRYLLVELPIVIAALQASGDLEDLPDRVDVVTIEDVWARADDMRLQDYLFLGAVQLRESLAAMDANLPEYRNLLEKLTEQLYSLEWATRAGLGCREFMVRQLENLGENRTPAIHLKGRFAGKTAVILGGGPSLDDILPWVLERQEQVAILAVSRVSRRLLEAGLTPHMVFSVDPQDISFDVSREMFQYWEKSLFVHSIHVSPKLLGQWRGRSLYEGERFPWATDANPENLKCPGPTVTNTALSTAIEMGFCQVILAGVDLCYSQAGMTHASGSFESALGPKVDTVLTVETNGGWKAETGPDYFKAMEVLGQQAAVAAKVGCTIVNPAPGAAKVANVQYLPLSEISFEPMARPIFAELMEILPEDTQKQRMAHYQEVRSELGCVKVRLQKIKSLAKEALDCNKGLFGKGGKKADFKYKIRMDKIEKRLDRDFADLTHMVKNFGISNFLKVTRLDSEKEWSDEEIEKTAETYYEAYRESASQLETLIEKALARISTREKEELPDSPLPELAEVWRQDGQPGRVLVWQDRRLAVQMPLSGQQALVAELKNEFQHVLLDGTSEVKARLSACRSLVSVRSKAYRLFQAGDREGLARLAKVLEQHGDQDQAGPLRRLVEGYLAEIAQDPDGAFEQYQSLIGETFDPLTEDALKRIAALGLQTGQVESASLALECLANAVFVYMPKYAELLRILGKHQAAADIYVDYLERAPSDLGALIKLGQLYQAMGAEDAARTVFGLVLEQDPENAGARTLLEGA